MQIKLVLFGHGLFLRPALKIYFEGLKKFAQITRSQKETDRHMKVNTV